jgi:MauM/NapG family ferredoxin protein
MKKLIIARRVSQASFLLLFIYVLWSTTYPLKGLIHPEMLFKTDPLIMIMTSIAERALIAGTILSVSMLILTIILGRFFCGWICPLGTMIDAGGAFGKIKRENDRLNDKIHPVKLYVLAAILIFAVFGRQEAWLLDPIVLMARFISLVLIPFVTSNITFIFELLIRKFGSQGAIGDLYHSLQSSVLGIKVTYFAHSWLILSIFAAILAVTALMKRLWCRGLCPLGALYSFAARFSMLRRVVDISAKGGTGKAPCRMGAIKDDSSYKKSECILCMDCVYSYPPHLTRFSWPLFRHPEENQRPDEGSILDSSAASRPQNDAGGGISRKKFLFVLLTPLLLSGFKFNERKEIGKPEGQGHGPKPEGIIRPPAALNEDDFLNRCVRCGNCMKVCPTNGLQPLSPETGYASMWTPELVPETGYCEYKCTLCGNTCPTGAIKRVTQAEKLSIKLGTASIDRSICIAWAGNKECIVCEEHCPIYEKAIKLKEEVVGGVRIFRPSIDEALCVGCGICQNKCPTRPVRAVRVSPRNSYRP